MPDESNDFEKQKIERLRRAIYSRSISGDIRERPRHAMSEREETLDEEWKDQETVVAGVHVAPRLIGATRRLLWWSLLASVCFFIAAVGIFGYYFTFGAGSNPANPANIDIVIAAPPQVAGGERAELQISITNRNRVPLELSELVVTFPPGTRKESDYETELLTLRQALGTIPPGERRQGTVAAVFAGAAGEKKTVRVALEYRVEGSNAIFVAENEYTLTFTSSPLSITVAGNDETVSGQPLEFTIDLTSNVAAPQSDVLVKVDFPFGFKFVRANPAPLSGTLWSVGDFAPGERKKIEIEGTLAGEQGDTRVFQVTAGTGDAKEASITNRLAADTHTVHIAHSFIGLAMSANQQAGQAVVRPGETVRVQIDYQNNLPTEVLDAILVARISGTPISGASVKAEEGFYRSSDNSILWDKTTTGGELARLAPGARGSVIFTFAMPDSEALANVANPRLDISLSAAGKRLAESGVPQSLQSTAQQSVRVSSAVGFKAQALYYANPFGQSGPIPPKAGAETNYALVFTVVNTTNKVVNARVTAELPLYVRWLGLRAPGSENLSFNQLSGTFTWDIGEIAAGAGFSDANPRQLAVAVALAPSESQKGTQPVLMRNVRFTGTDAETGVEIVIDLKPDVNTNLAQYARNSDIVDAGVDPGFRAGDSTVE